ncbi:MAG: PEGA domain-containing protein [Candidatus Thiodiazotropha sp.]
MPLKVESDPPGATIYLLDKAIGETPVTISQQQLYPAGYDAGKHRMYGSLSFRKEGCEDLTKRIHYKDFSSRLSVELNCEDTATVSELPSDTPVKPTPSSAQSNEKPPGVSENRDRENISEVTTPPASTAPPIHGKAGEVADRQSAGLTIKQRLLRIDGLKREGMISEEEYRQARKRILDEL